MKIQMLGHFWNLVSCYTDKNLIKKNRSYFYYLLFYILDKTQIQEYKFKYYATMSRISLFTAAFRFEIAMNTFKDTLKNHHIYSFICSS